MTSLGMLRRQPGFSATALRMLALGIGATTAIFSVRLSIAAPLGAAILSVCFGIAAVAQGARTEGGLALVGGTIYPSPADEPIRGGVVFIQNGKIAAVGNPASVRLPPNIESIDCSGLTITAGFWNSHVHFFERKWADVEAIPAPELARQLTEVLTSYGFTSVFDIGSSLENTRRLRSRIESGDVPGPRIRSTGEALVAPGAVPQDTVMRALGFTPFRNVEIADASKAAMASREILDGGADGNKKFIFSVLRRLIRRSRKTRFGPPSTKRIARGNRSSFTPVAVLTCWRQPEPELMSLRIPLRLPAHGTTRPSEP